MKVFGETTEKEGPTMLRSKKGKLGICLAALLYGTTALADVTAQQVWDDWQANYMAFGDGTITVGSQDMDGDTLTVSDFGIAVESDGTTISTVIDTITFTEQGDGTVSIGMDDEILVTMTAEESDSDMQRIVLGARHTGLEIIVSGTPESMDYAILASRYALEVDEVLVDGEAVPTEMMIAFNNINGNYVSQARGDLRDVDYAVNADSLDILVDVTDTDDSTSMTLSGQIEDVTTRATFAIPTGEAMDDPEMMFMHGFSGAGGYTFGASRYIFGVAQFGNITEGTATTGGSTVDVAFGRDAMRYDVSTQDIAVTATGTTLPFPIDIGLDQYGVSLTVPLSQTPEPAEFAFGLNFTELRVNEMIWDMLDAGQTLPRDPITLLVDVSGTVRLLFDILDPAQAEAIEMAEVPGELHSLSLNELTLSGVGASVTGQGDFAFDNTDLETFDGIPRPLGSATFRINGANALLDSLVDMGMLPRDQVMGARMMMGLFATPTGEDELTSTIEVNEQGHLLANGQRLQ
jgi:hypothetical protein